MPSERLHPPLPFLSLIRTLELRMMIFLHGRPRALILQLTRSVTEWARVNASVNTLWGGLGGVEMFFSDVENVTCVRCEVWPFCGCADLTLVFPALRLSQAQMLGIFYFCASRNLQIQCFVFISFFPAFLIEIHNIWFKCGCTLYMILHSCLLTKQHSSSCSSSSLVGVSKWLVHGDVADYVVATLC